MMGFGDVWFGMGWMWIFWLLLIAGLILLVVVAVRALSGGTEGSGTNRPGAGFGRTPDPTARAQEILAERFARGELSDEEYQSRLRTLRNGAV